METVIIFLFGLGCFITGIYASNNFEKWLSNKVEPYTEQKRDSEIKELSDRLDKFIKKLTGE
jgi:hypothetical protein